MGNAQKIRTRQSFITMLKTQINQYLQRDLFGDAFKSFSGGGGGDIMTNVKSFASSPTAMAATGGLSGLLSPALSIIGDVGSYISEHTSKMDNPQNIFKSWKKDDETGRQGVEGKEAITWTLNNGDQPSNEANAVLLYLQWKGNLNVFKGRVTAAQLRKKLRLTDLDDQMIEVLCDELNQVNGVTRPKAETVSIPKTDNQLAIERQLQQGNANTDTKTQDAGTYGKTNWTPTIVTTSAIATVAAIIYALNK